jgi:hypothetical protein
MELMIPTECPVSRAFTSYISLLINNISINNIKESTSYFPNNKYYFENINNYLEIQALGLTSHLTPYYENGAPSILDPTPNTKSAESGSDSRTLDSEWGI